MSHLDERTLARYAMGEDELSPAQQAHLDTCPECTGIVAELVNVMDTERPDGAPPAPDPDTSAVEEGDLPGLTGPRTPDGLDAGQPAAPFSVPGDPSAAAPIQGAQATTQSGTRALLLGCLVGLFVVLGVAWLMWR